MASASKPVRKPPFIAGLKLNPTGCPAQERKPTYDARIAEIPAVTHAAVFTVPW
ncbi:MAG: hypothetical protein ABSE51_14035 [Terracidiphilus sp.]|jgi:hypothetical protein